MEHFIFPLLLQKSIATVGRQGGGISTTKTSWHAHNSQGHCEGGIPQCGPNDKLSTTRSNDLALINSLSFAMVVHGFFNLKNSNNN